ncbi:hypothetical protein [Streptomyces sp. H51]|uniref:hypothetical protein n=1 Tax=Streptomyces sp. H51 TaxID=3111770 RepID=UPI002D78E15B|nr:hypothetical protein [Streptomyces sp. H51]
MTAEFLMSLDEGMLEYFRAIANGMTSRFGITYAEAVARMNERYQDAEISAYPDLMCHEFPEYWAYGLYYYPDDLGRLPSGDQDDGEGIDTSTLGVRPAPPRDSPTWTLRR